MENIEKKKENSRAYYKRNKTEILKKVKDRYLSKKEEIKEYKREYYTENKDILSIRNKKYRANNTEKLKAQRKKYNEDSKDKRSAYNKTLVPRFKNLKQNAKARGVPVLISLDEYVQLIENSNCHYCEVDNLHTGGGLDRLDSTKGYILENLVPCCGGCNKLKNNYLTSDETLVLVKLLKEMRGGKVW